MNSANSSSSLIPLPTGRHPRLQGPRVWDGFLHASSSGDVMCLEVIGGADAGQSHVHLHVAFTLKLLCSCGHASLHFSSVACSPYTHPVSVSTSWLNRIADRICVLFSFIGLVAPTGLRVCNNSAIFVTTFEMLLVQIFMKMEYNESHVARLCSRDQCE